MCCAGSPLVSFHSTEGSARGQPHNRSSCHREAFDRTMKSTHPNPPAPAPRPAGQWSLLFSSKIWGLNRLTQSHGQDTADDTERPPISTKAVAKCSRKKTNDDENKGTSYPPPVLWFPQKICWIN